MKNIKKISFLLAVILVISFAFSVSVFAHDSIKDIEENDKVYATIPWEYELSVFSDDLAYSHENGNYIEFCVDENAFAPEGITALNEKQIKKVFEHYYLYEGDLESLDEYFVSYDKVEKTTSSGYNCYYLTGNYSFSESELNSEMAYFFHACIFATKENIFTVAFESYEKAKFFDTDLPGVLAGIVFNGTHFEGDKPELNADHDFSNSPDYNEVVASVQGNFFGEMFEDEGMVTMVAVVIILFTVLPTLILIIIAIVLIIKYSKNKKKLKQYEMRYGAVPCYNQPANAPYQPQVNPAYKQNPVNQTAPQTPSYITNALNNLEGQGTQQPVQNAPVTQTEQTTNNNENNIK